MKIIFEDDYMVVCIKPVGVLSQRDASGKENMVDLLESVCKTEIFPLHRLDREVGGVMVFAKEKRSAAKLSQDIVNRDFKKEYIAFLHGVPQKEQGEMRDLLFKDSAKNKSYVVKRLRKGVKEALLEYELLESLNLNGDEYSKVKILLHTGRTHQIRVQFASRKMPLVADKKYGANDGFKRIGLWSYRISFNHPITKQRLTFCEEPESFI